MRIDRFRTMWGIEPGTNLDNWAEWFKELKTLGYNGVEVNIHQLDPKHEIPRLRQICDDLDFDISVLSVNLTITSRYTKTTEPGHSSWIDYLGPRPVGLKARDHLQNYREAIQLAEPLRPVSFNFQSGEDAWDIEESILFYRGTLEVDKELGLSGRVYHETHRNRSLFTPYAAQRILHVVPELRITADFSHWMVGLERLLDIGEGDRAMMDAIIPHVYHIHTRIGTTQASQCPEPLNPVFEQEKLCFERLWMKVLQCRFEEDPDSKIIFSHGQVADEEGKRLHVAFTQLATSFATVK
ncbi:hypothetical protein N7466_006333 [Penicillium verhagenii]|uniref:uncharacterized protein n=1 Tax=Penicillium verhagenii TaxID=1562060 RepID=UPI0025456059|nr:uncharacterized protein N7466_006333 [Penicillium verhagenii]KAJ5930840.1 hypothetical protein N7466_006333 [Penicillium verhagenii]